MEEEDLGCRAGRAERRDDWGREREGRGEVRGRGDEEADMEGKN